ncbi:MAG TPA: hypothetical protein VLU91_06565 [Nitrososphaerales archaeon]|nr:hypothetical protein [Nitrososphaerales archaeon]
MTTEEESLAFLINQTQTMTPSPSTIPTSSVEPSILAYKRFSTRIRHKKARDLETLQQKMLIMSDDAFVEYLNHLKTIRGNNGIVSTGSIHQSISAVRQFFRFTGIEFSETSLSKLVGYKKNNPNSRDIESALRAFSLEPPLKVSADNGLRILGIFKANFAPLQLSINTHFPPATENCPPDL